MNVNETFEALVKRQQETRDALETVEPGSLQHRILDDTLYSANDALAQHAEEAVAEIARLREQVDTLAAALAPFARAFQFAPGDVPDQQKLFAYVVGEADTPSIEAKHFRTSASFFPGDTLAFMSLYKMDYAEALAAQQTPKESNGE